MRTLREIRYKVPAKLKKELLLQFWTKLDYKKYCFLYSSYRHMRNGSATNKCAAERSDMYMAARPNPGAGIGHQLANWIAGFWFARLFGLSFAHIPFSDGTAPFEPNSWDDFLGLGSNEITVKELVKQGYKKVYLPMFDEANENHVRVIRQIIDSYCGKRVVFILEQDQFYFDQYGVQEVLKEKFYRQTELKKRLKFDPKEYNIAIHIRRGDIVQKPGEDCPGLTKRWLANDYFLKALEAALQIVPTEKPIHIYLFSQGKKEDYPEFEEYSNLTYCLDMNARDSFLHMVYADALITSKSSFSYKPALISNGLKFCPKDFWHGYPDTEDWHFLDNEGNLIV